MEHLNSYLDNVDCSALAEFCRKEGREAVFHRNEYFGRRGFQSLVLGYIEKGGVRYAATDDAGRTHTVGFSFEGDFAVDYSSFLRRVPALIDQITLEDTRMWVITHRQYFDFIDRDYRSCLQGRRITEQLFVTMYDRLLKFYLLTPEQRYVDLMRHYPYLAEKLTFKEIASFVGITPEALCRIRRRLLEK